MRLRIIMAAVLVCTLSIALGQLPYRVQNQRNNTLHVTVTTSIIADAVKYIAGDRVHVHCLMGPGVDPHSYHTRLDDLYALVHADLVLYNGLHLEGKMAMILEKMERFVPTHAVTETLNPTELIASEEFNGMYDPHVWFDIPLWIQVIHHIAEILAAHAPKHAPTCYARARTYTKQLKKLNKATAEKLSKIPPKLRYLVTTHDAFSYFARNYDFDVISLQGINLDAEPCIVDMQKITRTICNKKIPTLFVETSLTTRGIQALCKAAHAAGHKVAIGDELYADALGSEKGHDTYIGMFEHNVDAVVKGLSSLYTGSM